MSDSTNHLCRPITFITSCLAMSLLGAVMISSPGCAQAESRNWAQTSPLIEPNARSDADFHLSAHDDAYVGSDELCDEHEANVR